MAGLVSGKTFAPDLNPCDGQFEGREREERSLKRLHDAANALQIPLVASDTKMDSLRLQNLVHGGSNAVSFSASIFKETLMKFSLILRSQNHLPLVLVIASTLILLMQGTTYVVLSGVTTALKLVGGTLADHTFLFHGSGEAGTGITELIALEVLVWI